MFRCSARYRHEFQSNELWREIKYVLGEFAGPLTQLFNVRRFFFAQISRDLIIQHYGFDLGRSSFLSGHNGVREHTLKQSGGFEDHLQLFAAYLQNLLLVERSGKILHSLNVQKWRLLLQQPVA